MGNYGYQLFPSSNKPTTAIIYGKTENNMKTVNIVVPCYNEEAMLQMFFDES